MKNYIIIFAFGSIFGASLTSYFINKTNKQINNIVSKVEKTPETKISKIKQITPLKKVKIEENILISKEKINTSYEDFVKQIKENSYDSAFSIYSNIINSQEIIKYDKFLFLYIDKLIKIDTVKASILLNKVNEYNYDNFYYLFLELKINVLNDNISKAFNQIISLKNSYVPDEFISIIENYFNNINKKYYETLLNSENIDDIEEFIYLMQNNNIDKYTPSLQVKINKLQDKKKISQLYPIQIKIEKFNSHYLVPIQINNSLNVKLLLDTGASNITIKKELFNNVSYKIVKNDIIFNTANGKIKSDLVEVNSVKIDNIEINDLKIALIDNYKSKDSDGLLGQDFLNKFDWKIDQENDILYLYQK